MKYHVELKGTMYYDFDIDAESEQEAEKRALAEASCAETNTHSWEIQDIFLEEETK